MGTSFAQSFLGLKNLTKLTITDLTDDEYCIPFLENIGTCCPNLTHLTIQSNFLWESKNHILALVLGGRAKLLPKIKRLSSRGWNTQYFMEQAQFHPNLLSPICISLQHLLLECVECDDDRQGQLLHSNRFFTHTEEDQQQDNSEDYDDEWMTNAFKHGHFRCQCASHHIFRSFLTFILRHMPNLEKIAENCRDQNFEPSRAVEILYRVPSRYYQMVSTSTDNNSDSEGDWAGLNSEDGAAIKLLNKKFQLFRGSLSLVHLGSVNMKSRNVMTAIGSLCTRPNSVSFFHVGYWDESPSSRSDCYCDECVDQFPSNSDCSATSSSSDDEYNPSLGFDISDEQLRTTLLKDWPKVTNVKMIGVGRESWTLVASTIESQLTHLHLIDVATEHIHLSDLQLCTQLMKLEVPGIALPSGPNADRLIDADTFLPNLKKFKCHNCLGVYSHLFEEKEDLTHLYLSCSHISTAASKLNWDQVYYKWQNLQNLLITSNVNLLPINLSVLVNRLKKLKILILPEIMFQSLEKGRITATQFISNLNQDHQSPNGDIYFNIFDTDKNTKSCLFIK